MAAEQKALPITELPEVKEAIAKAVAESEQRILAALTAAKGNLGQGDQAFAEGLALAIAQLGEQGIGTKRVDPAIIRARAEARKRMTDLIVKARAEGKVPSYQLRNKVYLQEVLIDPLWVGADHLQHPTEIDWPGVPNDAMVPLNDTAKEIHAAFMESIGNTAKPIADDPLRVTAGGLVVRGAPQAKRGNVGQTAGQGEEGLVIHHRGAPGQHKTVNVLGTIAAPARQNM